MADTVPSLRICGRRGRQRGLHRSLIAQRYWPLQSVWPPQSFLDDRDAAPGWDPAAAGTWLDIARWAGRIQPPWRYPATGQGAERNRGMRSESGSSLNLRPG
jgi:hypothetical protein